MNMFLYELGSIVINLYIYIFFSQKQPCESDGQVNIFIYDVLKSVKS